jgi:hypothetical protein
MKRSDSNTNAKKLISISPGGYKGIYMLGTCAYIKKHYDTSNCIFSGASAGAWNALVMTCKKDIEEIKTQIIDYSIQNTKSINDLENAIKQRLLETYSTNDFDLSKLYIGITTLQNAHLKTVIETDFVDLEDAINCCIASSHIPFITGGLTYKYRNLLAFDGGFSVYPYLNTLERTMHITPDIWNKKPKKFNSLEDYTTLFSKNKYNFSKLYEDGYNDAKQNKEYLDSIFTPLRKTPIKKCKKLK